MLKKEDVERLVRLWENYLNSLPPDARKYYVAVPGYPYLIPATEIPEMIKKNPELAELLIELMME